MYYIGDVISLERELDQNFFTDIWKKTRHVINNNGYMVYCIYRPQLHVCNNIDIYEYHVRL